jgi:hypothetical protein
MLAKRKFQNFVNTYGDQSISGKKTFTENLVVTGECTLPDDTNLNITFDNSSISQSAIVSTVGWIYDAFANLSGSLSDLVNDLTNNTFGFLKTTDTISQNQISQTTENGWISAMYNSMYSGLTNLLAPKYSPTFTGEMTFPDGKIISQTEDDTTFWSDVTFKNTVTFPDYSISQDAIDQSSGWINTIFVEIVQYVQTLYALKDSPTFTGTVTFPNGSTISETTSSYLTTSTAASTYAPKASPTFTGTVTFPDSSTITDYLKSTTAANTYLTTSSASSTYAPKASPTFTGSINLSGDVTLASAYTNTLTLNDHLVLCTGSNFTTPVSGQQGYMITGTNATDNTSIGTGSVITYSTLDLSYGVWIVFGQIGYINASGGTSASISSKQFGIHSVTTLAIKYNNKYNQTNTLAATVSAADNFSRIVTVTNASTPYYLLGNLAYTGGPLYTNTSYTNFTAVRIA